VSEELRERHVSKGRPYGLRKLGPHIDRSGGPRQQTLLDQRGDYRRGHCLGHRPDVKPVIDVHHGAGTHATDAYRRGRQRVVRHDRSRNGRQGALAPGVIEDVAKSALSARADRVVAAACQQDKRGDPQQ
jgi:hypothetical protein